MFPQLESITLFECVDEHAFILLLEPPEPKRPSSLQKASKYPPKRRNVENPFPNLKELTISDMTIWTSLQAAIEKRFKNGGKSLRMIRLPTEETTEAIMPHLRRWLPKQGIELILYERGGLPISTPEFQDGFCDENTDLFFSMIEESWDAEDDDYEYWEERDMFRPDYELPNDWDDFYDDYDDEEDIEEGDEDEEDDLYEG